MREAARLHLRQLILVYKHRLHVLLHRLKPMRIYCRNIKYSLTDRAVGLVDQPGRQTGLNFIRPNIHKPTTAVECGRTRSTASARTLLYSNATQSLTNAASS